MSSNLNYKQAANVTRRTWDTETYEARAKARANNEAASGSSSAAPTAKAGDKRPLLDDEEEPLKEEFTPAVEGAAGPYKSKRAFLKARQDRVDIDSKVGTSEIVSAEAVATSSTVTDQVSPKDGVTKLGVGWHCKVCDCFLKDSLTYLDHINGRKHQRNLGYSMRVEKSTKDQVVAKLAELAKEEPKPEKEEEVSFEGVVKAKDQDLEERKLERARKRQERKKRLQQEQEEEEAEATIDPDMAAMMGFSGFGGGNKNH